MQYNELQEKYKQTQSLASNLHTQLAKAQTEAEEWREEVDKIRTELEEQIRILRNSLQNSENERKICEDKWQREFEMLRTHNMGKRFPLIKKTKRKFTFFLSKIVRSRRIHNDRL